MFLKNEHQMWSKGLSAYKVLFSLYSLNELIKQNKFNNTITTISDNTIFRSISYKVIHWEGRKKAGCQKLGFSNLNTS